jgi:hypothetical protein
MLCASAFYKAFEAISPKKKIIVIVKSATVKQEDYQTQLQNQQGLFYLLTIRLYGKPLQ